MITRHISTSIVAGLLAVGLLAGCESSTTVVITEQPGLICVAGTWNHPATGSRYYISQSGTSLHGVEAWQGQRWPLEGGLLDGNGIHLTIWAPNALKQITGSVYGETMRVTIIYTYHDTGFTDIYSDMIFHRH